MPQKNDRLKPTFLVIGAAKSGTTSLYHLFSHHPGVFMSTKKETKFFCNDDFFARGWQWYRSFFDGADNALAVGEVTPAYTSRTEYPRTAERIADALPDARLIYIVRHPVKRIESYWRFVYQKLSGLDINQFVRDASYNPWHLDRSKYWFQISAYRDYFPDDQILVLFFEDFKQNPGETLKRCFDFIGVDSSIEVSKPDKVYNKTRGSFVEERSIYRNFRQLPFFGFIRDLFPKKWREAMLSATGFKRELAVPQPRWDIDTRKWLNDQLLEDCNHFLEFYGKPADFWEP